MSSDLTSFVDFIDRFAEILHFISVVVFIQYLPSDIGQHSPVMQASERRREADNRETELPRSKRR